MIVEEPIKLGVADLRILRLLQQDSRSSMAHIAAEPDLSYSALARRSNVTVQTMTASIKALQTSGHIAPRDPTQAGRAARLLLTPHGRQTLAAADQSIAAMSDGWLPLDADERQTLASLLGKVVRATVERAT